MQQHESHVETRSIPAKTKIKSLGDINRQSCVEEVNVIRRQKTEINELLNDFDLLSEAKISFVWHSARFVLLTQFQLRAQLKIQTDVIQHSMENAADGGGFVFCFVCCRTWKALLSHESRRSPSASASFEGGWCRVADKQQTARRRREVPVTRFPPAR